MRLFGFLITISLVFSINPVISQPSDNLEYGVYTSVKSNHYEVYNLPGNETSLFAFMFKIEIWNYQTSNISLTYACDDLSLYLSGRVLDFLDTITGDLLRLAGSCASDSNGFNQDIIGTGELKEINIGTGFSVDGNHTLLPFGEYRFSYDDIENIDGNLIFPSNVTILSDYHFDGGGRVSVEEDQVVDGFGELDPFETVLSGSDLSGSNNVSYPNYIFLISLVPIMILFFRHNRNIILKYNQEKH